MRAQASAEPGGDLVVLAIAITSVLAIGLPLARAWAGRRVGEEASVRRRATSLSALGMVAWLALTGGLAGSGVLDRFGSFPPPVMPLFLGGFVLTFVVAFSRFGRTLAEGLPLWFLVGYQAFRVAVEVMLHRAWEQGVIGVQMTWSGLNFDVVTGLSAAVIGLWLWRRGEDQPAPKLGLWAWNLLGAGLLVTIVTIAVLSMPAPFRVFEEGPANEWVATLPFVWLPMAMVTAALLGHLLLARRLWGKG